MLGSPMLYLKGMRAIVFQLSGFYYATLAECMVKTRHHVNRLLWRQECFHGLLKAQAGSLM